METDGSKRRVLVTGFDREVRTDRGQIAINQKEAQIVNKERAQITLENFSNENERNISDTELKESFLDCGEKPGTERLKGEEKDIIDEARFEMRQDENVPKPHLTFCKEETENKKEIV